MENNEYDWSFTEDREWMATFSKRMKGYATRLGGDPDDAVQNGVISMAKRGDAIGMDPGVAAWRVRGGARSIDAQRSYCTIPVPPEDFSNRPRFDVSEFEDWSAVGAIIESLTSKLRRAVLARTAGYTFKEIGEVEGVGESAIRQRISMAREIMDRDSIQA